MTSSTEDYSITKIKCFRFNADVQQWQAVDLEATASPAQPVSSLRLATFNCLHNKNPWFSEKFLIRSDVRHRYQQEQMLPALQADVIALQEVVTDYLTGLMSQEWVQKDYYISDVSFDGISTENSTVSGPKQPHGCLLMTRIKPVELYAVRIKKGFVHNRQFIGAVLPITQNESMLVFSVHTVAYQEYALERKHQIEALRDAAKEVLVQPRKHKIANTIAMGDLNLHDEEVEDKYLQQAGWVDLWKNEEDCPENSDDRYTFDYHKNWTIVKYIPIEAWRRRRMRLDRITMLEGSTGWQKQGRMRRFATEDIPESYTGSSWFPHCASDHYGLVVDIARRNL